MESSAIVPCFLCFVGLFIASTLADGVCENVKIGSAPSIVPDSSDCTSFHICYAGKGWMFRCGPDYGNKVFDPISRTCVSKRSKFDRSACRLEELEKESAVHSEVKCIPGVRNRIAHPEHCARYHQCTGGHLSVEMECPYPRLYNKHTSKCEVYMFVKCGSRLEPKDPCEYETNQCRETQCVPCRARFGSCIGLKDGPNAWEGKPWTPHFVICKDERVILQGDCRKNGKLQIFNPITKKCRSVWQLIKQASLAGMDNRG